ncbi:3-hydroxyacyl-CoA dehydrogenase family protein [Lentilactobacillus sp. Marseille-Q4993]|uniref:3-hydroxyacyl-CoA dehydrogenase family protein n=1 Tax=Lentilactobacillus sp. Marseille-Q4993 TaxID=3039492 RepID=UPI0032DFED8B
MKISDVKTVANIGAGTMGHAIALQFAIHGYNVNLLDNNDAAIERGIKLIDEDLKTFVENGIVDNKDVDDVLDRIDATTDYETALTDADFVIESIVEDIDVKKQVWQRVEKFVGDEVVLATNTSGLSPTEIASVLKNPQRFVVAHFWNPAQLMPLVEVVPGEKTNQTTVDFTTELITEIGKHAVPLKKESLGFVGNRIQLAVLREALSIVEKGIATPEAVDDIVKYSLGRRWSILGPIISADLGGLDVFDNISKYLYADLANETGEDQALKQKVLADEKGRKSGKGFYDWQGDEAERIVSERDRLLLKMLKEDN